LLRRRELRDCKKCREADNHILGHRGLLWKKMGTVINS
jgi:hypothetical protein